MNDHNIKTIKIRKKCTFVLYVGINKSKVLLYLQHTVSSLTDAKKIKEEIKQGFAVTLVDIIYPAI